MQERLSVLLATRKYSVVADDKSESFIAHFAFCKARYVTRALLFVVEFVFHVRSYFAGARIPRWGTESPLDCNKGYVRHTARSTSVFISFRANEVR